MRNGILTCILALAGFATAQAQTVSTLVNLGQGSFGDGLTVGPSGDLFASEGYNGSKVLRITLPGTEPTPAVTEFATGLQGAVGGGQLTCTGPAMGVPMQHAEALHGRISMASP